MNPAKEIGVIIKTRRKTQKLSQKELSVRIFGDDSHNTFISRLENGQFENSGFITIFNVMNALNIDLISLIKNS